MGNEASEISRPPLAEEPYRGPGPRVSAAELEPTIADVDRSPIVDGLMEAVQGLMAVVNDRRQIVAINEHMLHSLGISDPKAVFGLRLGEVLSCVHAGENPLGCGNSEHCPTCGAAVAQLVCQRSQQPVERLCAIDTHQNGTDPHFFFRVRVSPLSVGGERLMLIFLQDVSHEQRVACLERIFLHDLNNTATGLSLATTLLADDGSPTDPQIVTDLVHSARRLVREIELQRCLALSSFKSFTCENVAVSIAATFDELERACRHHPAALGRTVTFQQLSSDRMLSCDPTILHRILYNMVINALEATDSDDPVRVSATQENGYEVLNVWNPGAIAPAVAGRIFRRNFSTKGTIGRGLGTYSMKLLGEQLLGGIVSFTASENTGTCFRLALRTRSRN